MEKPCCNNTAVNSLLCVKPSFGLADHAMAWSGKLPVAELEKDRSRELDNLLYM